MTSSQENAGLDSTSAESLVITFPDDSSHPKEMLLWAGVLVLLTLIAYWPATQGQFIWNDDLTVVKNPMLAQPGGLASIWTQRWSDPAHYPIPQYHPFTYTVYWLEFQLYGHDADGAVTPFGFHVTNLLLGAGAAVLVWLILRHLQIPGAWVAAAVFALHPLNAESIAWISQLASVLAGVLFFGAIYTFLLFTDEEKKARDGAAVDPAMQWGLYAASIGLFIAAMLSKSTAFAMPFVTLLVLWWQRRVTRKYTVFLLPMMFIGIAMAFSAADFERAGAGTGLNFAQRLILAGRAIWFYAGKVLLPIRLSFLYPKWSMDTGNVLEYLPLVAAVTVIALTWVLVRALGRGPAVAISAFVICLIPALGFFDQIPMQFTFVADHYAYLATAPLIALVVAAATRAIRRAKLPESRGRVMVGIPSVLLIVAGSITWTRARVFSSELDLWQDTVGKNPDSWLARDRYATALGALAEEERGIGNTDEYTKDLNDAMQQAERASALNPGDAQAQSIIGRIDLQQRKKEEGIQHLRRATELDPNMLEAWQDLATAAMSKNQFQEAIIKLDQALALDPNSSAIHRLLGEAYAGLGENERAISEQRLAMKINPGNLVAESDLADVLAKQGRIKEAKYHFAKVLQVQPDRPELWYKVAILCTAQNNLEEAAQYFRTTLKLDPNYPNAQKNLELAEKMLRQQAATRPTTAPATRNSQP